MAHLRDCLVGGLVVSALTWGCSVLFVHQINDLLGLRGAVTCNCQQCGNATEVIYECGHWAQPWPPNPRTNACSSTWCIKNRVYYAECPEMANGAECPHRTDNTNHWVKQERWNAAPAACANPDYTVHEVDPSATNCIMLDVADDNYACDVGPCPGAFVPPAQYRTPRKVCNL